MEKLNHIESQLISIDELLAKAVGKPSETRDLLNIDQCSELTGLSTSTLYKKVFERLIPHYKSGKRLVFKRQEVLDWMVSNPRKTVTEIEAEANQFITNHKNL